MATEKTASPSGLEFDGKNGSLRASHDTTVAAFDALERMWDRALVWCGDNPYHFAGIILLLAFWIVQRRRGRNEAIILKNQYQAQRDEHRSKLQQDLPLSLPRKRKNDDH